MTQHPANWFAKHHFSTSLAIGVGVVSIVALCALFAPWIAPHDPNEQNLAEVLLPPAWDHGGMTTYLLGTDRLGRDILSRVVYGARISLLVSTVSVAASGLLGSLLGVAAGYFSGWWDRIVLRTSDIMLSIPFIMLAIAVVAALGASVTHLIIVFVATRWVQYARVAYAQTLSLRERDYVSAAQAIGVGHGRILLRHILPNALGPLIVLATLDLGFIIIIESGLSFLGLGVPPQIPSWGGMLSDGRDVLNIAWWASTFPGLAIVATVVGFNLVGDWLSDILDPTRRGQAVRA